MEIRKCQRCSRFFNFIRSPYCGECLEVIDREFRRISRFLAEHPDADAAGIAAGLEIDEQIVLYLLREDRLELKVQPRLPCLACGQPIRSGRYCAACLARLSSELHGAAASSRANRKDEGHDGGRLASARTGSDRPAGKAESRTGDRPRDPGMYVKPR